MIAGSDASRTDALCSASMVLELQDEVCARGIYEAILPESLRPPSRSRVKLKQEGQALLIEFEAEDVVALRASVNSYLRWICALKNSYQTLKEKGP